MPCKFDWYQNDSCVFLTLLRLQGDPSNCTVSFKGDKLIVRQQGNEIFSALLAEPVEREVKVKFGGTKKVKGVWKSFERAAETEESGTSAGPRHNTTRNWDSLAKEVDKDPECNEGEELSGFFKKIYSNLDENGQKAMMKSMSESCGTVLSTNWNEVKKDKVLVKPPDGVEYKKYE